MTSPSQDYDFFVPVYDAVPENWNKARQFLVEQLRCIAVQVNARSNGYYLDIEQLSGNQLFPGTSGNLRGIFRKVIDLGALINYGAGGSQSIAHGISTSSQTRVLKIYGCASDPGASTLTQALPLPYVSTAGNHIQLNMDATNITLTGIGNYSAFTQAYAVVEYVDES